MDLTSHQIRNISHTIYLLGHSCPVITEKKVLYRDQTPGQRATFKTVPLECFNMFMDEDHFWMIDERISAIRNGKPFVLPEELEDDKD